MPTSYSYLSLDDTSDTYTLTSESLGNASRYFEGLSNASDVSIAVPKDCKNCQTQYCGCADCKEYNPWRKEGYCKKDCYIEKEGLTKALKHGIIVLDKEL